MLPYNEDSFVNRCTDLCGKFYDVKVLRDHPGPLHDHLKHEKIAQPSRAHQAGSDCLCTLRLFFKTIESLKRRKRERDIVPNCIKYLQESYWQP